MNKISFSILIILLVFFSSCSDNDKDVYPTKLVTIQLVYPEGSDFLPREGAKVKLVSRSGSFEGKTDTNGKVAVAVPNGFFDIVASDIRQLANFTGTDNIAVDQSWNENEIVNINLKLSLSGSIIIKEIHFGGAPDNTGSKTFQADQYVILYNNTDEDIELKEFAFAVCSPANSHGTNNNYIDGKLYYEEEGWIPGGSAVWTFGNTPILEARKQLVIAFHNAVDNTVAYKNSINFANKDYYCCYDPESGYNNKTYYSPPSPLIPTNQYLKAYRLLGSKGNAWTMSVMSPAFFVFSTYDSDSDKHTTIQQFMEDANTTMDNGSEKKVAVELIGDGVEVFKGDISTNKKRLTLAVDAGSVNFINKLGYTIYRNVDKEATEAIPENSGRIVYNYSMGTENEVNGSTDPSGIDAEASMKNGARIVYLDTNNSTTDFHQRRKASLRD